MNDNSLTSNQQSADHPYTTATVIFQSWDSTKLRLMVKNISQENTSGLYSVQIHTEMAFSSNYVREFTNAKVTIEKIMRNSNMICQNSSVSVDIPIFCINCIIFTKYDVYGLF